MLFYFFNVFVSVFFHGIVAYEQMCRLMVSNKRSPWILATPESSQVHSRFLGDGEEDEGKFGVFGSSGFLTQSMKYNISAVSHWFSARAWYKPGRASPFGSNCGSPTVFFKFTTEIIKLFLKHCLLSFP